SRRVSRPSAGNWQAVHSPRASPGSRRVPSDRVRRWAGSSPRRSLPPGRRRPPRPALRPPPPRGARAPARAACTPRPSSPVERLVLRRLEPDDEALAELDYRSLDERGLRQHERQGLFPVEAFLLLRRELAKGRSRAVQKRFPSEPIAPRG